MANLKDTIINGSEVVNGSSVVNGNIKGNTLQTTTPAHETNKTAKIAVISNSGYINYKTPAEFKSDTDITNTTLTANSPIVLTGTIIPGTNKRNGDVTVSHATSGATAGSYGETANQTPAFGGTIKIPSFTVNNTGHITTAGTHNLTIPSTLASSTTNGLMTAADKAKLNGIASGATKNASTVKSFTLSASSWSDWTQSISDSLITATSNQEVLPAIGISKEQLIAFQKAMIVDAGQSTGKFTLRVMGTLPTIDIPIRVIFRGTI